MKRLLIILSIAITMSGCSSLTKGDMQSQVDTISAGIKATTKAARPISDREEYYVGRAVAARLVSTYSLLDDAALTRYLNEVGDAVAMHSDKPLIYGGYHFAILNSGEINAFSCPGGIIFVTKGLLHSVKNEDELAAVLAHEVAHVNHRDGISSIKQSRWAEAATIIGSKMAKNYSSQDFSRLVNLFEGSIDDIVKTLIVNGFSQSEEYKADETALTYLLRAGYNPEALKDYLERLVRQHKGSGEGILKTHPATADRIERVKGNMPKGKIDMSLFEKRTKRFHGDVRLTSSY